jgi:hypothetical protein
MVCRGGPFSGDGFDAVKLLSGRCGSSLLASAIRYTEVTKECVAVIVSHHGLVEFMTASEPFRSGEIAWLPGGWSRPRIARELGIDRETVGRYLRLAKPARDQCSAFQKA